MGHTVVHMIPSLIHDIARSPRLGYSSLKYENLLYYKVAGKDLGEKTASRQTAKISADITEYSSCDKA